MADDQADPLADLISRLWRNARRSINRQGIRDTARALSQETPRPPADDLQQLWHERIFRMIPRLSADSQSARQAEKKD
jgi:hypothetical protein